jgi:hypothetical protein
MLQFVDLVVQLVDFRVQIVSKLEQQLAKLVTRLAGMQFLLLVDFDHFLAVAHITGDLTNEF